MTSQSFCNSHPKKNNLWHNLFLTAAYNQNPVSDFVHFLFLMRMSFADESGYLQKSAQVWKQTSKQKDNHWNKELIGKHD